MVSILDEGGADDAWKCEIPEVQFALAQVDVPIVITMKARLVRIGNSRGVRFSRASHARAGWAEAASAAAASSTLLDPATPTRFDEDEWQW